MGGVGSQCLKRRKKEERISLRIKLDVLTSPHYLCLLVGKPQLEKGLKCTGLTNGSPLSGCPRYGAGEEG